jgi:hypothetical protein
MVDLFVIWLTGLVVGLIFGGFIGHSFFMAMQIKIPSNDNVDDQGVK